MDFRELFYWDHHYNFVLLFNLFITIGLFTSIRLFSGTISHINATDELLRKDNPAFGISMAGVIFAVTLVLSSVINGEPLDSIGGSIIAVGVYGILGIVLMSLTRFIFDRFLLPKVSIRNHIIAGNIAAGITDAGNVIATAIIVRAVIKWVNIEDFTAIQAVLLAYVVSQLLLSLTTTTRLKLFSLKNPESSLTKAIESNNVAVAVRFAGHRIGTAFAIAAASNIMVYEINNIYYLIAGWAALSLILMGILEIIAFISHRIILLRVDVYSEVVNQRNVALGTIQGVIYISLGLLLYQLMA
ncbi:MAG: DUF350 domain-containing protein [Alphaproteobacteria bacterium]|nr:DUF350 domain-containing protein [Alphaproteobacteria bacterium]